MKLTILKIATKEPEIQGSVPPTLEDTFPPFIHAVTPGPTAPRSVRRLDVNGVLARSVPKTAVEVMLLNEEQTLSRT